MIGGNIALSRAIGGDGGETGIRTLGGVTPTTVFETAPFDRSGISPLAGSHMQAAPPAQEAMRLEAAVLRIRGVAYPRFRIGGARGGLTGA